VVNGILTQSFSVDSESLNFPKTKKGCSSHQSQLIDRKANIKVILHIAILSVTDKGLHTKRQSNMEVLAYEYQINGGWSI
jgi:hypothetical protein